MSKPQLSRGRKLWLVAWRAALLLLVWGLCLHFAVRIVATCVQQRQLSRELAREQAEYRRLYEQYAEQLWEGDRLAHDRAYQRRILKDSYYYFEQDEQPLIVIDE